MKSSEILREVAARCLEGKVRFICNAVKEVTWNLGIYGGREQVAILAAVQDFIGEAGITYDSYLCRKTGCALSPRTEGHQEFVNFLRHKLCIFLAEQFELEGD